MSRTEEVLETLLEKLDEIGIEAGVEWSDEQTAHITYGDRKFTVIVKEGWGE